ncbi:MAG: type II toxin-antitoxin system prevent-host-death family antitoxin [Polyangiaceae bacterium]
MDHTINAKELRASLPRIVERVRRGEQFTVVYRSRPAFRVVPVGESARTEVALAADPLYRAPAVGASKDGLTAADHDAVLYGK